MKRKTADGKMVMMRVDNKGDAVMVKEEEQDDAHEDADMRMPMTMLMMMPMKTLI